MLLRARSRSVCTSVNAACPGNRDGWPAGASTGACFEDCGFEAGTGLALSCFLPFFLSALLIADSGWGIRKDQDNGIRIVARGHVRPRTRGTRPAPPGTPA